MTCGKCGGETEPARAFLHSTIVGVIFYGFSWMKLAFALDRDPKNWVDLLQPGQHRVAHWCSRCRILSVTETPWIKGDGKGNES